MTDRFEQQLQFVQEIDKLKHIQRQSILLDASRRENSAEHSWHISMMAIIFKEYIDAPDIDLAKVIQMLLIHDIVEIDAGDTFAYDVQGHADKEEREQRAAKRIFGLLPQDQADAFHQLWCEYEALQSPEAQFAMAIDRLQPLMHNYFTQGKSWQKNDVTSDKVLQRMEVIKQSSEQLWQYARQLVFDAVEQGYLPPAE